MLRASETIFLNGAVVTVNKANSVCEAFAVCDNKISFVGTSKEATERVQDGDTIIDLIGRSVLPGFNDVHAHAGFAGSLKMQAYVFYPEAKSISEMKEVLKEWVERVPRGGWIIGRGWDEDKYEDRRRPNKHDLDDVAPDHFVFFTSACGHMSVANSKLLESEGINAKTPDPPGGKIERDSKGEPTGVLLEHAHIPLKLKTAATTADLQAGLMVTNSMFMENGVTSVGDMSGRSVLELKLLMDNLRENKINFRTNFAVRVSGPIKMGLDYIKAGLRTGFGNEWLRIGCFKAQLDGSDVAPSAAMWSPYPGEDNYCGILHLEQAELDEIIMRGHEAGFQICAHAMGTKAIEMALDSFEKALTAMPQLNHRFRIEHCHLCEDSLADRIMDLGVVPVLAPSWIYWVGDSYLEKYQQEWLDWVVATRRFLDRGIRFAFHSDLPVIPVNPLAGIYSAVTRKTESGAEVGPKQAISVYDAIRAYTYNGAFANFEEKIKGSIEVGKLADVVVLSDNILTVDPNEIKNLKVDLTMVDGKVVFSRT